MILYLIRHAQSENNALAERIQETAGDFDELSFDEYRLNRSADPSLTTLGFQQAEILAQFLQTARPKHRTTAEDPGELELNGNPLGITSLYCSVMLRALQTAQPIGQALGLRPRTWVDLHEHGGMFANSGDNGEVVGHRGLSRQELIAQFPDSDWTEDISDEGWWFGSEEDYAACQGRAIRVASELQSMAAESPNQRIALVSHGTFLDSLLKALTGRLPGHEFHYSLYNTSICRLDLFKSPQTGAPITVVRYTNRVDHLSAEMIT